MPGQSKSLHHFVPKSYLRPFSNAGSLASMLREPYEVRDTHVNNVAAEHGFYKVFSLEGLLLDDVEDALADFDGTIPGIVSAATGDGPLFEDAQEGVRRLYAVLLARNHQGRDQLLEEVRERTDFLSASFDSRFPDEPAESKQRILDVLLREHYDVPSHLGVDPMTISRLNIMHLADELLSSMPDNVCIMRSGAQDFTTSDAPCAYFDPAFPRPKGEPFYGPPSLASPTLELTLPLDRRHVALISNKTTPDRVRCNLDAGRVVNARTACFAKRMVLSYPHEDEVSLAFFIAEVLSEQAAFDTSLLDAF